ncbi:MAG: hypothetical protein U0840_12800 [Gemmataceae bacterium]
MPATPDYPPALLALVQSRPLAPLGPGRPATAQRPHLAALSLASFHPHPVVDPASATACLAGLWLAYDFLDESHRLSQDLTTPEGSFWHAIMHRREPDAWNSKYWWRRVGSHPVLDQLGKQAPALGYSYTTPDAFVDFCERVRASGTPDEVTAQRVQALEWDLLFAWCFDNAITQ